MTYYLQYKLKISKVLSLITCSPQFNYKSKPVFVSKFLKCCTAGNFIVKSIFSMTTGLPRALI